VKIGYTAWLDSRLALLRKEVGRLRLLGLTRGGPALEAELHRRFAMARKRGEWFAPVQPLLDLAASSRYVPARAHGKKWRSIADGWF
jgi:hypothetical protein